MPDYYVKSTCVECGEKHSAQIRVFLGEGPEDESSIAEFYSGKELPKSVSTLVENTINVCPHSGKEYTQLDPEKVFLSKMDETIPPEYQEEPATAYQASNRGDLLDELAKAFSQHPNVSRDHQRMFSQAFREMGRHPLSRKIVGEVLTSMLFKSD